MCLSNSDCWDHRKTQPAGFLLPHTEPDGGRGSAFRSVGRSATGTENRHERFIRFATGWRVSLDDANGARCWLALGGNRGRIWRAWGSCRTGGTGGDAISKADAAMSRLVIAAGLKLIVVPIDSTWMRRSLASGSRARASHASRARAGRSRQCQSKWAGSTRRCTRTALVTAPFLLAPSRPSARSHVVISARAAGVPAARRTL